MADVSVRAARDSDAPAIARAQIAAWRAAYAELLPAEALRALEPAAVEAGWRSAVLEPPDPRARVLVAVDDGEVVGVTTTSPAGDDDLDPDRFGELGPIVVTPERQRRGHGSRLLAAAVDHLRDDGFRYAVTWLLVSDEGALRFLAAAAWEADGASRTLDIGGTPVREMRLHTDLLD